MKLELGNNEETCDSSWTGDAPPPSSRRFEEKLGRFCHDPHLVGGGQN